MELTQLTYVLNYIEMTVQQNQALTAYDRLLVALETAEDGQQIQQVREEIIALHQRAEPVGWSAERLQILTQYGARPLLGDPVIARLNQTFIDHFMNPAGVASEIKILRTETQMLLERVHQLLAGLEPLLTEARLPLDSNVLEEFEEIGRKTTLTERIREKTGLSLYANNTLVPIDQVALRNKIIAAAPIVLAAAGKAFDLYRIYAGHKSTSAPTKLQQTNHPIKPTPNQTNITQQVRYTYRQSVYIFPQDKQNK